MQAHFRQALQRAAAVRCGASERRLFTDAAAPRWRAHAVRLLADAVEDDACRRGGGGGALLGWLAADAADAPLRPRSGCRRGRERRAMRHACCVRVGASVKVRSKLGHQYTRLTHTHSLYPGTQKGPPDRAHSCQLTAHGADGRRGVRAADVDARARSRSSGRRHCRHAPSRSLHVPFRQSTCGLSAPHRGAAPTQTTICQAAAGSHPHCPLQMFLDRDAIDVRWPPRPDGDSK